MPTSTLSGWSFANHGPLTTTFTAPTSCFTSASQIQLGSILTNTDTNATAIVPYYNFCNTGLPYYAQPGNCIPSGKAIESQYAKIDTANPTAGFIIDYYSPGLYCPSNYVTVGTATNNAGSITSSGDGFVPTATADDLGLMFNPGSNILLQGLDRGEAAVLCCPKSFQADVNGNCFSPLPSQPLPSEICYTSIPNEDLTIITATVSIFGTPVTDGVLQETNSVPVSEIVTQTIMKNESQSYTVVSVAPMVTLIHDAAAATGSAGSPTTSTTRSGASSTIGVGNWQILLLSCWFVNFTASVFTSFLF